MNMTLLLQPWRLLSRIPGISKEPRSQIQRRSPLVTPSHFLQLSGRFWRPDCCSWLCLWFSNSSGAGQGLTADNTSCFTCLLRLPRRCPLRLSQSQVLMAAVRTIVPRPPNSMEREPRNSERTLQGQTFLEVAS
jgi:hypothetical protein